MTTPPSHPYPPAIIFDFGGVLLDWDPRYLYRKLFHGDEAAMESFLAEIDFYKWNLLQDAGRPFAIAVDELCTRHPQRCDLIRAYHERYPESLGGAIHGTVDILRHLWSANYPLFALSNWSAEKFYLVRSEYEFFDWFQGIIISGEVGAIKPDRLIFKSLLDLVGRPAEECLLIDDSPRNIGAAQALGFQTILFLNPAQLENELSQRGLLLEGLRSPGKSSPAVLA